MAWFGAMGAMFFALTGMLVVAAVGAFRGDRSPDGGGAGGFIAMVGLAIGATLLGFVGLLFVMTANSDSFGR